jgi:ferritin-like metal-binding protein YciE
MAKASKTNKAQSKPAPSQAKTAANEKAKSIQKASAKPKISTGPAREIAPGMEPALRELFVDGIKDIYWAERQIIKALPKMIRSSTADALVSALTDHLAVTKKQAERLEKVFELLGEKIQGKKCDAMEGLAKEGEGVIESTDPGTATRDVGIIMASQKVEHYEIAAYGGLTELAATLGLKDVANLLAQTLAEEKESDMLLTGIARNDINYQATAE